MPLGTLVTIMDNNISRSTFIVDDKGRVYVAGLKKNLTLLAVWGRDTDQKCLLKYNIKDAKKINGIALIEGTCE